MKDYDNRYFHIAQDDLSFGGVGESGMGAYHGIEGFRTLSHASITNFQGRSCHELNALIADNNIDKRFASFLLLLVKP